jgi:hypothetical protein
LKSHTDIGFVCNTNIWGGSVRNCQTGFSFRKISFDEFTGKALSIESQTRYSYRLYNFPAILNILTTASLNKNQVFNFTKQ